MLVFTQHFYYNTLYNTHVFMIFSEHSMDPYYIYIVCYNIWAPEQGGLGGCNPPWQNNGMVLIYKTPPPM